MELPRVGLIPAHAGKTSNTQVRPNLLRAHPRPRGENFTGFAATPFTLGSSPPTRGKLVSGVWEVISSGLIPAHAGKTPPRSSGARTPWAHPRPRGENDNLPACTSGWEGSSPPTRGKRTRNRVGQLVPGLIPAHAGKTPSPSATSKSLWAHPRPRGENLRGPRPRNPDGGSSPPTRGKHAASGVGSLREGLIPAHAGKTSARTRCRPRTEAHPRPRGENRSPRLPRPANRGSSPPTRGKQRQDRDMRDLGGLIPAHAGKTERSGARRPHHEAHPRSRGENLTAPRRERLGGGSSPLTRGKLASAGYDSQWCGLIPAHAGKTRRRPTRTSCAWAHPRSRGENAKPDPHRLVEPGSSPLTRGKRIARWCCGSCSGLIPAHAGKTHTRGYPAPPCTAHPRSRGENANRAPRYCTVTGSSPLTRGKQLHSAALRACPGLIPAHAGKTTHWLPPARRVWAHPRSRGENILWQNKACAPEGSSPLTRGKLTGRDSDVPCRGLIPAHAGKTRSRNYRLRHRRAHPRSRGENIPRQGAG